MNVIDIAGLDKSFGSAKALDRFDLTVDAGEIRGFLGPNGAGKSTTIRILLGLLRADAGQVRVFDADPWVDAVALHRRLVYVPGDVTLWPNLTGGEIIDYLSRLSGSVNPARKSELCERFELDPTKKARTYSKGNRQKVALVAAFARDVDLYVLDEPTSGLDPLMEAVFTDYVRDVKAQGGSVLLSSHILSEVEKVCDTVTIIRSGRTVESGTLGELRHLTRSRVEATISGTDASAITGLVGIHNPETEETASGTRVTFDVDGTAVATILRPLADRGVTSLRITPPSLEDVFMRHYSGDDSPREHPVAHR